jgi:hypothetical protein
MPAQPNEPTEITPTDLAAPDWVPSVFETAYQSLMPQQKTAAALIASGVAVAEVARQVGVDRTGVWRWMRNPNFLIVVGHYRKETWDALKAKMLSLADQATSYLAEVLADEDAPRRDRLRAAELILRVHSDRYNRTKIITDPVEIEAELMEQ